MSIDGQSIAAITIVVIWTGVMVLAKRATTPHPVRRGAFTFSVGVSAALLSWLVWSRPQPQPSDLAHLRDGCAGPAVWRAH